MARSYRRAVWKDGYGSKYKRRDKRMASKAVRRFRGWIPEGGWYKRLFDSWDICDYVFDYRFIGPWRFRHMGKVVFVFGGVNYWAK